MMDAAGSLSIGEKIEEARSLYAAWEDRLRRDGRIGALLARLEQSVRASRQAMQRLGVVDACKRCEELEGGSCCGYGIENRYDGLELLINLLLGVSLPLEHAHPDSCYFLQACGCSLRARHVLCVNYLCAKLQKALSREDTIALQAIVGEELETGFALYEAIKQRLGL